MKRLNDASMPKWPSLYFDERKSMYVVAGKHPTLFRTWLLMHITIWGGLYLYYLFVKDMYRQTSAEHLLFAGFIWIAAGFGVYFILKAIFSKETRVRFFHDRISKGGAAFELIPNIQFRVLPHKKIMRCERLDQVANKRYRNYGHVVMEYGDRTVSVCHIANEEKADHFTRMLAYAYERACELNPEEKKKTTPKPSRRAPKHAAIDDELPE